MYSGRFHGIRRWVSMPLSHRRDPDRLFPVDAGTRSIARDLYDRVAAAPIISPHGHVAAAMLDANLPFSDAAELLVTKDHYVTRLLHAAGVPAAAVGLGPDAVGPREIWRTVAGRWHLFAGT